MNNNASKWVASLRSGKYKQGRMALRKNDKFCCLGVACDLYASDHPDFEDVHSYDGVHFYGENNEHYILPMEVKEWLGLYDSGGQFKNSDGTTTTLADLNDWDSSFDEIANIIESEPLGLFESCSSRS